MSFMIGETVGAYRLTEQLGQGGMATVYKAYHAKLDRYVAIKVLHQAFTDDPNFLARFQREARVIARLEHPNIVPVHDYSEHELRPYLVMKYIEGETLKARLQRGPLAQGELLQVVESVGAALTYAHQQGVLHRDIKPSNVILAKDGKVFLADFGLARIADSGDSSLTADRLVGTPQYISPEQALSKPDLDARTDVYSFGVMLYELVVGRVPFSADTPFAIIHDHIYTPLPLPRLVNPQVSEPLERVLLKALAKERGDRFSDIQSLVTAFTVACGFAAGQATVVEPAYALPQDGAPVGSSAALPPVPPEESLSPPAEPAAPSRPGISSPVMPPVPTAPAAGQGETVSSPRNSSGSSAAASISAPPPATPPAAALQPPDLPQPASGLTPPPAPPLVPPIPPQPVKRRRIKPLAAAGLALLALVVIVAALFVLRGVSQNAARRTAQAPTIVSGTAPTLQQASGNRQVDLESAVAAWQKEDLTQAAQQLEKARIAIGEDVNLFKSALQYLEIQKAFLLEAMLLLNPNRPSLAEGVVSQVENMHALLYKAAADKLAGDFMKRNTGKPLFDVAPIRYETWFGELKKARDELNKVIANRTQLARFPEARLLQVEQLNKAGETAKARQELDSLLKDRTLPDWVSQMARDLDAKIK